jgi:hypothetical protein
MPQPTAYQNLLLECPLSMDLVMPGPRGSGKSRGLLWLCARDVAVLKDKGRFLFLRASFPSLREVEADMRQFFPLIHPGAKYNASTCIWQFPNGATLELGYCDGGEKSFTRYLGRSFSTIIVDEVTLNATPSGLDMLRSCLRAPDGTPTRMIAAGNPGFIGHEWFKTRWVEPAAPVEFMVPSVFYCEQTQRQTVVLQAEIKDNPHIDYATYTKDLELAAGGDQERLKAWLLGDWDISAVGAALADVFSERRSQTRFDQLPPAHLGRVICGADWGTASPSAFYLGWCDNETKDLTLFDELYTCGRGRDGRREYHRGVHQTAEMMPAMVAEWIEPWGLKLAELSITMDNSADSDAMGINDTAIKIMRRGGMRVRPMPQQFKKREAGYVAVRQRLNNASRSPRGLYWDRRVEVWRDTACLLERDPKTGESVAKSVLDHSYDGVRYTCMLVDGMGQQGQSDYRVW